MTNMYAYPEHEELGSAVVRREPFLCFYKDQVLAPDQADSLLLWFETGIEWALHESHFFVQHDRDLREERPPQNCEWLFQDEWVTRMRRMCSTLLGADLSARVKYTAHRLVAGQGIGLHNDAPIPGRDTHRVIIQLNRSYSDKYGGHLVLFNSKNPNDVACAFRPVHNSCVGFELSRKSYHAVVDIKEGVRYTLVLSFWSNVEADRASTTEKKVAYACRSLTEGTRTPEVAIRISRNVERTLQRWGFDETVSQAGLCHYAYGTGKTSGAVDPQDRQHLRTLIGDKSEQLVYGYRHAAPSIVCNRVGQGTGMQLYEGPVRQRYTAEECNAILAMNFADVVVSLQLADLEGIEVEYYRRVCIEAATAATDVMLADLLTSFLLQERAKTHQEVQQFCDCYELLFSAANKYEGRTTIHHSLGRAVRVCLVLQGWGCSSEVQLVGLCHELYIRWIERSSDNRKVFMSALGYRCERGIYAYSRIARRYKLSEGSIMQTAAIIWQLSRSW